MKQPPPKVYIVRTGTANIASVTVGLKRSGAVPVFAETPEDVERADRVVLPGVGAFGPAMKQLRADGFAAPLRKRIEQGRATLAVCLGLQLLCEESEESPDVSGLGVIPMTVKRFTLPLRVPQLGWNSIEPLPGCKLLKPGYAYFANSYRLSEIPEGWNGAMSDHGGPFVAALERGCVLACQFHPELSGSWGLDLIRSWIALPVEEGKC